LNILTDVLLVNKEVFTKTIKSIKDNWQVLFVGIVYLFLGIGSSIIVSRLFIGPLRIASGLVLALVESAIISSYIFVLYNVLSFNRFRWSDVKNGFTYFIWKVYAILFMFYLGSILLGFIGNLFGGLIYFYLMFFITIASFIVLNPLPEAMYIKTYNPWETVLYCFDFIKENWINWILPNIIFFIVILGFSGSSLLNGISLFGGYSLVYLGTQMIGYIIGSIFFSFGMIYRGHLFTMLSTSNRRKRQFMRKV